MAAPRVDFKARVMPITGFPYTGNVAGGGAMLELEYKIAGGEYGGFAPPLRHLSVALPKGMELHPDGFPTCPLSVLEPQLGPHGCPRGSLAGPAGTSSGHVAFGNEIVPETASIQVRHSPGGGLSLEVFGHDPVLIEVLSQARFSGVGGQFGTQLEAEVPLVETVPGARDLSFQSLALGLGTAASNEGHTIYYLTIPMSCPRGFLPFRSEAGFAGLDGLSPQTVTSQYRAPCPEPGPEGGVPRPLPGSGGVIAAPYRCAPRHDLRIQVLKTKQLIYERVTVEIDGRRVQVIHSQRRSAQIDLRGLPEGSYVTRVSVVTDTGRVITGARSYRTCPARP